MYTKTDYLLYFMNSNTNALKNPDFNQASLSWMGSINHSLLKIVTAIIKIYQEVDLKAQLT